MNCLCFLLWRVPNFLVHTGGFLASVFRHSSNGKNLAAVGVGQQVLQGSHVAQSALLHGLRDTHLESANLTVDWFTVRWHTTPLLRLKPHQQLALLSSAFSHRPNSQVLSREVPQGSLRSDRFTSVCQTIFFNSFTGRTKAMSLSTPESVQQ
jgi:hypothetical protein